MNQRMKYERQVQVIFGVFIFGGMLVHARKSGIYETIKRVWGNPTQHQTKTRNCLDLIDTNANVKSLACFTHTQAPDIPGIADYGQQRRGTKPCNPHAFDVYYQCLARVDPAFVLCCQHRHHSRFHVIVVWSSARIIFVFIHIVFIRLACCIVAFAESTLLW